MLGFKLRPCDGRMEQLVALHAGKLSPEERLEIVEHLKKCKRCTRAFENHQRVAQLFQRLPRDPITDNLPPELERRWAEEDRWQENAKRADQFTKANSSTRQKSSSQPQRVNPVLERPT